MFGLEKIGQESVQEAHATVKEALEKLDPLLRDVENRFGGILHGLLDRVKLKVEIEILPVEKAVPVNPSLVPES